MKIRSVIALVLLSLCYAALIRAQEPTVPTTQQQQHNLMPAPAAIRFARGRLPITKSFAVSAKSYVDDRLRAYIDRTVRRLEGRTGLEFKGGRLDVSAGNPAAVSLVVDCQAPGQSVPALSEDESYSLEVSDKQAVLTAQTVVGAMRGLETFLQLLDSDQDGYFIHAVSI